MKEQITLPEDLTINSKDLRKYTFARIGLEKTGISISMKEVLAFRAAHAAAKDALFTSFKTKELQTNFELIGLKTIELHSAVKDRNEYLQRPDLGRILAQESKNELIKLKKEYDICIIISDGLSALASNEHSYPLIKLLHSNLLQKGFTIAPIVLLHNGRVAASDQIGELLNAKLSLILVGERPGLSSPDSLGAYFTYQPKIGKTDESRNCVSNIRPKGLNYEFAAQKLSYLITNSLSKQISGTGLKDEMNLLN